MRRLTGLFAVLLMALTVSPVMASSTSDSATNDYTATVNSDIQAAFISTSEIDISTNPLKDASSNSIVDDFSSLPAGGAIDITINPTDGGEAAFGAGTYLDVQTNVAWNLDIIASGDGNGNFGDGSGGTTTKPLSDLFVDVEDHDTGGTTVSNLGSAEGAVSNTTQTLVTGNSTTGDFDLDIRYVLDTPDDMNPGQYATTLTWTVVAN